ncbi:hypothetical protein BDN72DRAFT_858710 [Pluteus cervinus]|uniref:Uncharacterized protein n=1 Tax=Pluteus cervinus TaxID=181527 RepID=A0ACD3ART3_9AGAR|nr:hypothetical protein BDN72DRAFT_858710 [Pluteus cervinus]
MSSVASNETRGALYEELPPLHNLPLEVLQDIFVASSTPLASNWEKDPQELVPCLDLGGLKLGHICKAWRVVTRSMPEIFSSITIYHPTEKTVEAVKLYLELSGPNFPLNLALEQHLGMNKSYLDRNGMQGIVNERLCTLDIIDLWIAHAERWKKIQFNIVGGTIPQLANIEPSRLRNLEEASLELGWPKADIQKLWDTIHTSPALRFVMWHKDLPPRVPPSAPLSQLTSIGINFEVTTDMLLTCLSSAPQVRKVLVFRLKASPKSSSNTSASNHRITLRYLDNVCIGDSESLNPLLNRLTTPSLAHMLIRESKPEARSALVDLFTRSRCQMKELHLDYSEITEDGFIKIITSLSPFLTSLEKLSFRVFSNNAFLTEKTLFKLTPSFDRNGRPIGNSFMFPKVYDFFVGSCKISQLDIATMIIARKRAGIPFCALSLHLNNPKPRVNEWGSSLTLVVEMWVYVETQKLEAIED